MNLILFDDHSWKNLLPLTFNKPISELRVGILRIREKWEKTTGLPTSTLAQDYLSEKYPCHLESDNLYINGSLLPDREVYKAIENLKTGQALKKGETLLASRSEKSALNIEDILKIADDYPLNIELIDFPWKIFLLNGQEINADYQLLTQNRQSQTLSATVNVIHPENIFIEEGFEGEYFTINATNGPIYLGADSEIMEGAIIRGPFALCNNSTVKLGAKIYGPTTIGPYSKAGGEINNSILQGYANKGHDGFLGQSVIGEWCNIGADTNTSNLKNNYTNVKLWSYNKNRFTDTGLQFCGLIMGDHSKCGINTMFNTGTVVGVSANIFGTGFPRNFIPSFSWGGATGMSTYLTKKAFETMNLVMGRRNIQLSDTDINIYEHIYDETEKYR